LFSLIFNKIFLCIDYIDEQHSPQAMGIVQHQAPDTTSPSPPHQYNTNGNTASTIGNFPSGKENNRI
jgi:hypothetical protein